MIRKLLLMLLLFAVPSMAQTLSLTRTGSGNADTITVVSSGQFKLVWSAADNWGLDGWYDLVNDASATTNLASPSYGVNGPSVPCGNQAGLANLVFYSELDEMGYSHYNDTGCNFPSSTRSATVLTNTSSLVVIETTSIPSINSSISSLLTVTTRYYVYPNGKIYVRSTITTSGSKTLGKDPNPPGWGQDMVMTVSLPNSLQTGSSTPDSQSVGWVRATTTQNPYDYLNTTEAYFYTYWGSSSGAYGYGSSMTPKASLMIVPNPNNTVGGNNIKQAIHSWGCTAGCGVTRLGYNVLTTQYLTAGQSLAYEWLIQLGTQGSGVLPNMTATPPSNCSTCSTLANAYIADPAPPGAAGLMTGMTPNNYVLPPGYTLHAAVDFENGTFGGGGAYGNGNFVTTQYHADGNAAHNHSIKCQVGGVPDCGGNVSWTKPLPVGTKEVYLSFWEYLPPAFRMNDEMFLSRFWWNTGTGQPSFREAIFDYFMNSTKSYNATDATLLWNIQGQPYIQNKLPGNRRGDNTNFNFTLGSWVQHEIYTKFSTFTAAQQMSGTVTLNKAARTYTCSICNWTALGVHVGDSIHFTGFSNGYNNGDGAAGGGGSAYFVKSMTSTVLTMDDEAMTYADATDTANSPTIQIDHGDGAYRYLKNGVEVSHQNSMVFPGKVDFSTQATNLSVGESYTKLIWHTGAELVAPFTSPCSTNMVPGTDHDNLAGLFGVSQYGWNGSGWTASSSANLNAGIWDTHIPCDSTWGGPMPTPPVFDRHLDDIIVAYNTTGTAGGGSGVGGGGYTPPPEVPTGTGSVKVCTH